MSQSTTTDPALHDEAPGSNRPSLTIERTRCEAFEAEMRAIGRGRVSKAIQYGHYLNEMHERHFTRGGAYWKTWEATLEAWGLERRTLENYRLLAAESENLENFSNFSSLTAAYEAARVAKAERRGLQEPCQRCDKHRGEARRAMAIEIPMLAGMADTSARMLGAVAVALEARGHTEAGLPLDAIAAQLERASRDAADAVERLRLAE